LRGPIFKEVDHAVREHPELPREAVWVTFDEIPPPDWYVAGKPGEPMKK
jgi:phenylpyruvate tautomerase PptA (4-oxalocrotonate tautomerase family)